MGNGICAFPLQCCDLYPGFCSARRVFPSKARSGFVAVRLLEARIHLVTRAKQRDSKPLANGSQHDLGASNL